MNRLAQLLAAVGWGALGAASTALLQLALLALMARLLEPADFGLVAMANLSLRLFAYFAQMGVTPALIQKPQLDDGDRRAALAVSIATGALCALLAVLAAPLLQRLLGMPGLRAVVQALALNFLIAGASAVSAGLLRRDGRFRRLALIDTSAYAIGYGVVGVVAARAGCGVWALVLALLAQNVLTAAFGYLSVRYPIGLAHSAHQRRHFLRYGSRYSLIGLVEFLGSSLDALVIGRFFGSAALGHYSRASLLANLPVQQPANVLTGVLFPLMSSVADRRVQLAVSFQLSTLLVGGYACAVGFGIAVAAPDLVLALLGPKWLAVVPVLPLLACSVGMAYLSHVAGVTLDAINALGVKLRVQTAFMLLQAVLLLPGLLSADLRAVAAAVLLNEVLRVVVLYRVVLARLPIPPQDRLAVLLCIVGAAGSAVLLVGGARLLVPQSAPAWLRLLGEIGAGAIGLAGGSYLVRARAARNSAVIFMARRSPYLARLLPGFA